MGLHRISHKCLIGVGPKAGNCNYLQNGVSQTPVRLCATATINGEVARNSPLTSMGFPKHGWASVLAGSVMEAWLPFGWTRKSDSREVDVQQIKECGRSTLERSFRKVESAARSIFLQKYNPKPDGKVWDINVLKMDLTFLGSTSRESTFRQDPKLADMP